MDYPSKLAKLLAKYNLCPCSKLHQQTDSYDVEKGKTDFIKAYGSDNDRACISLTHINAQREDKELVLLDFDVDEGGNGTKLLGHNNDFLAGLLTKGYPFYKSSGGKGRHIYITLPKGTIADWDKSTRWVKMFGAKQPVDLLVGGIVYVDKEWSKEPDAEGEDGYTVSSLWKVWDVEKPVNPVDLKNWLQENGCKKLSPRPGTLGRPRSPTRQNRRVDDMETLLNLVPSEDWDNPNDWFTLCCVCARAGVPEELVLKFCDTDTYPATGRDKNGKTHRENSSEAYRKYPVEEVDKRALYDYLIGANPDGYIQWRLTQPNELYDDLYSHRTQAGYLADWLASNLVNQVIFVPDSQTTYVRDKWGRWNSDPGLNPPKLVQLAKKYVQMLEDKMTKQAKSAGEFEDDPEGTEDGQTAKQKKANKLKHIRKVCEQIQGAGLTTVLMHLRASHLIVREGVQFDKLHHLLTFNNGTYDFQQARFLSQANPDDYVSRSVGYDYPEPIRTYDEFIHYIETNPIASEIYGCLVQTFGSQDEAGAFIKRTANGICGKLYNLFYIFKGSAGNGKSLIANTLFQRAFGDYYGTPPSSLFAKVGETRGSDNPDPPNSGLANIEGKRVLVVSEPPTNAKSNKVSLNEPTIKMITGHDPITARRLHKDYAKQPFVCSAHSILLLNDDVQFRPTPSLERRVRILEFPSQFKSQEDYDRIRGTDEEKASQGIYVRDDTLSRKFATLPYAIEFMRMVLSMAVVTEDFYNEDFKELPNVLEASRQAFIGQDYVADFVATYFEQTTDEDEGITNALLEDLHARYRKDKRIAPSNAVGSLELSTTLKNFHGAIPVKKRNLMDRGFKIQHENVRGLRGIKLKEQYSQPQEPVLAVEQKQMLNMTEMFQAFLQAQAQARPQEQVPAQVPARRLSPKVPSVNPRNV